MTKPAAVDVEAILRDRISRREIPPGAKLRELPLTQEFGVSRASIRQAFAALEQRGLVKRVPNQGVTVMALTAAELFTIYDVFELLEGLCARLAVQNSEPGSWRDLVDLFGADLEKSIADGDCDRLFDAIMTYRRRTVAAADNPTLSAFLDSIYDKTQVIIRRTLVLPGRAAQSFKEHREIIAAMQAGDALRAEALKRSNMRTAREFLVRYIDFVL
ncbi:GntR family transcriptional regulator [Paracandidimonas soli]|nr:GntR family transcriptional regulator [Paracandidimonas soli]